ncbi:T9SS type A sorting domain-containing protein [Pedobacter alpinus]|uniref:T9SS type A sorting domain-containing protein n=1 Tax=Pedobacter alpinus TaxID=1590643 RepID=A0ABW5TS87_9SPHI
MKKILLSLLLFIPFVGFSQIVTFSFTGALGDETTFAPNAQPSNAVVSSMSRGSSISPSKTANKFNSSSWPTAGLSATAYYEFTITPNANVTLNLSSLSLSERRSLTGVANWELRSSNDSYSTTIGTVFTVPDNDLERTGQTISLPATAAFSARTTPLTFRIYGYNAEGGAGTWRIDDVVLNGITTLPISLTSFTAKAVDETILINWATASEKNNKSFEVLKSYDGKSFTSIATLNGAGNSDSEKTYSFVDENPYAGANYYKLKQTDFDGKTAVSEIVSATAKIEEVKLSAFASSSSVSININSPNQTIGTLSLFDMTGRKLDSQSISLTKGFNAANFSQSVNNGIYFINLIADGKVTSLKFVK